MFRLSPKRPDLREYDNWFVCVHVMLWDAGHLTPKLLFICESVSVAFSIWRGLTPPHRVKSISMASFSPEEVELIKARGNEYCKQIWLGLYDAAHGQDSKDEQQIKDFMIAKYERKRYYVDPTTIPRNGPTGFSSPEVQSRSRTSTPQSVGSASDGKPSANVTPTPFIQAKPLVLNVQTSVPSHDNMFTPDKPSEFLADFGSADPFSSSSQAMPNTAQPSFANFENNPVFSDQLFGLMLKSDPIPSKCNTNRWSMPTASALSTLGGFGSPARKAASSMGVNQPPLLSATQPPSEDRYAALKDLDSLMKSQQQQHHQQPVVEAAAPLNDWSSDNMAPKKFLQYTKDLMVKAVNSVNGGRSYNAAGKGVCFIKVSAAGASPWPVSSSTNAVGASVFSQAQSGFMNSVPSTAPTLAFPEAATVPNPFAVAGATIDPWAPTVGTNGMTAPSGASFNANPFRPAVTKRPNQPGFGPAADASCGWGAVGPEVVPNGAILSGMGAVFPTSQSMNFPAKVWHNSVGNPFVLGASPAPTGRSSNPFL
ncbi:Uncharacterized protein GBIM_02919 [Gryllus bimaculatus]|nr:Uncharacterized protein GBIM_02919 [Gryllus bimaculatus]